MHDPLIKQMRIGYAKLETIDPCGPSYAKLCKLLDQMPQEGLKQLAAADIKFVSKLARNRVQS